MCFQTPDIILKYLGRRGREGKQVKMVINLIHLCVVDRFNSGVLLHRARKTLACCYEALRCAAIYQSYSGVLLYRKLELRCDSNAGIQ
jgi:hypothetical protein